MNRAIILIDEERDGGYQAVECLEQSERRGYGLVSLMRDIDRALDLLLQHIVSAVAFPSRIHRLAPVSEPEPDTDDTAIVTRQVPAPRAVGRCALDAEWIRDLIDRTPVDNALLLEGVEGYREGYADGYVDCLMIRGPRP